MADFHNISDLRAINLLEAQLRDVQFELRQLPGYDPAESLAENVKSLVQCGQILTRWIKRLCEEVDYLKKEQENDKMVARGYPFTGVGGIISNAQSEEAKNPSSDSVIESGC